MARHGVERWYYNPRTAKRIDGASDAHFIIARCVAPQRTVSSNGNLAPRCVVP
jgi:hypothetical protein